MRVLRDSPFIRHAGRLQCATPWALYTTVELLLDMTDILEFQRSRNMESRAVILALGALAQESRLEIFRMLVKRGPEGFTPGEIAERLSIPAPTLSFHLKELQVAQLTTTRRDGRFVYYSANLDHMDKVLSFLTDNCCALASSPRDSKCMPKASAARKKRV